MDEKGQNQLGVIIVILAVIAATLILYGIIFPTICTAFEPIAAEPIC